MYSVDTILRFCFEQVIEQKHPNGQYYPIKHQIFKIWINNQRNIKLNERKIEHQRKNEWTLGIVFIREIMLELHTLSLAFDN